MPQRLQRSRARGWRAPEGAVYVGRPTRFGNPILMSDVWGQFPSLNDRQVATLVVRDFETLAHKGTLTIPNWRRANGDRGPITWTYPSVGEIRRQLAGRDLLCWCAVGYPCHADILLTIAGGA